MPAKKKPAAKKATAPRRTITVVETELAHYKRQAARLADALDTEKLNHQATAATVDGYLAKIRSHKDELAQLHAERQRRDQVAAPAAVNAAPALPALNLVKFEDIAVGDRFTWCDHLHERIEGEDGQPNALHKASGMTYALDGADLVTRA